MASELQNDFEQILCAHNIKIRHLNPGQFKMSQPPKRVIRLPQIRILSRNQRPSGSSGVKITNVKSIKPPDPEHVKKMDEEKLRKQLSKEIEMKSRDCCHKGYECTLPVLNGREYCHLHILQDPTAPYRQCAHTYSNGKPCPLPTPVPATPDKRDLGLCYEHARCALLARQRSGAPPLPQPSTETYLNQLQHYIKPQDRQRTTSCTSSVSVVSDPGEPEQTLTCAVDPFKQIDSGAVVMSSAAILSCCSDTDSDADSVLAHTDTLADISPDDTDLEDPLVHAGIFTAEEAVSEAKNTLKNLQEAYIRQMGRLKVLLQNSRYRYLKALKAEREQFCSISSQVQAQPPSIRERKQLRVLRALAAYRRPSATHGPAAVMARKFHKKRAKVQSKANSRGSALVGRCIFSEGGVRCSRRSLPAARHCLPHVLHDRHQVLFSGCRGSGAAGENRCSEVTRSTFCTYHHLPLPYTVFTLKKEETDSEDEMTRHASEASQTDIDETNAEEKSDATFDNFNMDGVTCE